MRFNNGSFGACICILALLGTACAGFFLSVEQNTREATDYEFVTDVSGLFTYTDTPEYISYNPSSNLTGYGDGVGYTASSTVNNYRYIVSEGATHTTTETIDTSSSYTDDWLSLPSDGFNYVLMNYTGSAYSNFVYNTTPSDYGNNSFNGYLGLAYNGTSTVTKLSNILNSFIPANVQSADITITNSGSYPVFFVWSDNDWYLKNTTTVGVKRYYWMADLDDNNIPTSMHVDVTTLQVTLYKGSTVLYTGIAGNIGVVFSYHASNSVLNPTSWPSVNINTALATTYTDSPTYGYMNPNAGVTGKTWYATWTNGYTNSIIDIKIIKNGDASTFPHQCAQFEINEETIAFSYDGSNLTVYKGSVTSSSAETIVLGAWLGVQMRIDALNGDIILTPTNNLDLLTTVEPTDYSTTLEDYFTAGALTSFKVARGTAAGNSLKFQVTDTVVFLNTYNTVMVDATLDIADYFPSYSEYRLNLYSFAIFGDYITINGQMCEVDSSNATITFENDAGVEYTKTLSNIYITFVDGYTWLTFVNDGVTYDLGETESTKIIFGGSWYFTTGLYKAVTGNETYWDWDLDGTFHASAGECLIVFLGIIVLGIILYTAIGKGHLGYLDWLVIIFAAFLGSCILGF